MGIHKTHPLTVRRNVNQTPLSRKEEQSTIPFPASNLVDGQQAGEKNQ
jgi:hypothetical protein